MILTPEQVNNFRALILNEAAPTFAADEVGHLLETLDDAWLRLEGKEELLKAHRALIAAYMDLVMALGAPREEK